MCGESREGWVCGEACGGRMNCEVFEGREL